MTYDVAVILPDAKGLRNWAQIMFGHLPSSIL